MLMKHVTQCKGKGATDFLIFVLHWLAAKRNTVKYAFQWESYFLAKEVVKDVLKTKTSAKELRP